MEKTQGINTLLDIALCIDILDLTPKGQAINKKQTNQNISTLKDSAQQGKQLTQIKALLAQEGSHTSDKMLNVHNSIRNAFKLITKENLIKKCAKYLNHYFIRRQSDKCIKQSITNHQGKAKLSCNSICKMINTMK